ncbi:pyruvate dehydrogenase (acetyl-transferring) E1 component subunit alpha [Cryobacterium sp. Hz9]|uniref:pyruvate dehydrogenase (acetyl-transferring) E1 component subunit alpha n=1 Tax=Cryobacterium sp. Hz9 TaxID=1259167 RepID=UPI00106AFD5F|nr:pyruvate dehydrogenase (acetyl-transferring) E1 component subunit alpha [Cryobacterium sp. Hz9]TFB67487.1 pyruvate dehydrogenase (acetyl-transferring) E1 component subunit alpha [Cryobacterium sp. Hz9]
MATKARTRPKQVDAPGGDPAGTLRDYYEQMSLVRAFELRSGEMYARAKIGGYCHLNLGEEATVVGLMAAIEARDYLFTAYRDHGYALLRGLSPERVMAELFGKTSGVSGGRGGSMHLFDAETRLFGGYGIVGGQIPPATGAALALKYQESAGPDAAAVMCLLGDGTTNIGAFHESLNLAGLWKLPIVYVIVNNGLGMGTTVEKASAEPELYKRAASYRMPGLRVDGDDVLAVRDAARDALQQARELRQPVLLEVMCYRLRGHSVVDPARYRSPEDTTIARQSDPVPSFRAELIASGVLSEADATAIDEAADARVTEAVTFAEDSPEPDPDDLFAYVYATAVANAPSALPGEPVMDAL